MDENIVLITEQEHEQRPSISVASRFYLLVLLLMAVLGTAVQVVSVAWGLVVTEIFLIFLPAYLYLRWRKLPVAETIRWRWPGWPVIVLALLVGLSLNQFAIWMATVLMKVLDFSDAVYAGIVPETLPDAIVLFVGMLVLAPLCEEFLFRGMIQRGYEARGIGFAIVMVSVMFSFFHLSFLRFLAIMPFALLSGWMFWRSNSLVTSIVLHFAYNFFSALALLLSVIWPDISLGEEGNFLLALAGLVVGLVLLVFFHRITPAAPELKAPLASFGWQQAWPLIPAALVILVMAGAEFYVARHPELLAPQTLELTPSNWPAFAVWHYEIRNRADKPIGEVTCQRSLVDQAYQLDCLFDHQQAYKLQLENSYFQDDVHQEQVTVLWHVDDLNLLSWQSNLEGDGYQTFVNTVSGADGSISSLNVSFNRTPEAPLSVTPDMFLPNEWPWRLAALPFDDGLVYDVNIAYPLKWSPEDERSRPTTEVHTLWVRGKETIETPAGIFEAWKVTLENESAWYTVEAPHDLIQYDNDMSIYILSGRE